MRRLALALAMVAAVALPACQGGPPAVRTIALTIHYSHFNPPALRVEKGSTVRFTITNSDPIDHEFILGDEAVQQREEKGTDTIHNGQVPGMVSVPAGATASTVVSFRSAAPATLIYACHLPGHYAFGMRGTLEIVG
jgi:uncharacterized cupredoxin-like copper-binding protein